MAVSSKFGGKVSGNLYPLPYSVGKDGREAGYLRRVINAINTLADWIFGNGSDRTNLEGDLTITGDFSTLAGNILIDNNKSYRAEDTSGNSISLLVIDTNDDIIINRTALAGTPDLDLIVGGNTVEFRDGSNAATLQIDSSGDVLPQNSLYFPSGSGGLVFGGISCVDNTTETTISSAGVAVQVTVFDTNGPSNLSTPDHTNDHITIGKAGDYLIIVSATVNSIAGADSRFEMTVQKNNGASNIDPLHVDRNMAGGSGASGSVSMSGIATLAANDTIEVWIENETNTQNYVVENCSLSVIQIGG